MHFVDTGMGAGKIIIQKGGKCITGDDAMTLQAGNGK